MTGCVDRAYDFGDSGSFDPDPTVDPDPTTDPDPTVDPDPTDDPPGIPGPPQLVDVRFADNLTLQLTFTEAIAPTQAVDPQQFRLSAAFGSEDPDYYLFGTFYQEVGQFNGGYDDCYEYCYQYCDYEYDYCYCDYCYAPGPPIRVASVTQLPELPEVLLLTLDNGIGSRVCDQVNSQPPALVSDLFIHYTAAGSAPVTDNDGEALAPISEKWALAREEDFLYEEGFFPFMNPMLPIPCPF